MSSTNRDVWLVSVNGGELKQLTTNPAADEQPEYSPDGKTIAVRAQRRAGFESDRWYIDLYDVAGGTKRTLFAAFDKSADDFRWAPDGRSIWFTGADHGTENLYSISLTESTPKLVAKGGAIGQFTNAGAFGIFAKSSLTAPTDIYRVSVADGAVRQLTAENAAWLRQVDMPDVSSATAPGQRARRFSIGYSSRLAFRRRRSTRRCS